MTWRNRARPGRIERTYRGPTYSDAELKPFFAEISKGYCYKQSADRCGYCRKKMLDTIYSDDEVGDHTLQLSMVAGALIRAGELEPPPDRYDGLWDEYLTY